MIFQSNFNGSLAKIYQCLHFTSAYFWTDPDVKLIIPSLVDLLEDFVEVLLRLTQQGKVWVQPSQPGILEPVLQETPSKIYKLAIQ